MRALIKKLLLLQLGFAAWSACANNMCVTNVTVIPRDATTAWIEFDISWENSWRDTDINHDAAWVFFKVRQDGSDIWNHAPLEADRVLNPSGYSAASGTSLDFIVPDDKVGLFVRRKNAGSGTLASTGVKVLWNFAANGLAQTARVWVKACALEMVFVAEGQFYLGCGADTTLVTGSFTDGAWTSDSPTSFPFLVTSEDAITMANQSGCLWGTSSSGNSSIGPAGVLSNDFPKGYAAFYCMKYEITQGQHRDFLNSLTREQQIARTQSQQSDDFAMKASSPFASIGQRIGLRCPSDVPDPPDPVVFGCDGNSNKTFNEENDAENRASGNLSWADFAAYADWSGLRPMSELEYEKACRGPLYPVPCEYAWGSSNLVVLTAQNDDGTGYATVKTPANANCYHDNTLAGPRRAGLYATATSSREQAGASYWGIMEMTGNVNERIVSVSTTTGRSFTGAHGDGVLTVDGKADVVGWPSTTAATGAGMRGGRWYYAGTTGLHISNRVYANLPYPNRYQSNYGGCLASGRWVRTAPSGVGP